MMGKTQIFLQPTSLAEETEEIPTIPRVETSTMMEELTVTDSKILLALKSLNINKSPGPDEKGARLLVELSKSISHPLRTIFETSIKTASIPKLLKRENFSYL